MQIENTGKNRKGTGKREREKKILEFGGKGKWQM